jgi:mRNA-degrading endonuclease RelE of RelBE toxin-antitoxin system
VVESALHLHRQNPRDRFADFQQEISTELWRTRDRNHLVQVARGDMIPKEEYPRLTHAIVIDTDAIDDLRSMRAYDRSAVLDVIERILSTTPTRESKSRIKRLRGLASPAYRLRVGEFRVFYNVLEDRVQVLRVLPKPLVDAYLEEIGYETEGD